MASEVRRAEVERRTRETQIRVALALPGDAPAPTKIDTPVPFLSHMLDALGRHGAMALEVEARGDVEIDDHHTVEDVALAIGRTLDEALGDRSGIVRFADAHAPLDEALARAVVDCSGRPYARIALDLRREQIGTMATENITHALQSLATTARLTLHVDVLVGENDHHRAEAAFKATALALRSAVRIADGDGVPSTKGVLR